LGLKGLGAIIQQVLWWVLAGSRGGPTRAKIIFSLKEKPMNAHQLAEALAIDYKTVRRHLELLVKNRLLVTAGGKYGLMYFISPELEEGWDTFRRIWEKLSVSGGRLDRGVQD